MKIMVLKLRLSVHLLLYTLSSIFICNAQISEKILVTSINKCGTGLLLKCISLLTGKRRCQLAYDQWKALSQQAIDLTPSDCILFGHIHPTEQNIHTIVNNSLKTVFIYRDPRDYLVSLAYWVKSYPKMWPELQTLNFDKLLFMLIKNIPNNYTKLLQWRQYPFVYVTTFERLVGTKGNGNLETQLTEIQNIARHIGIPISLLEAKRIAYTLFGNTFTFRRGKIGSWKGHFNKKHIKAFKAMAGQLLIDLGYEKNLHWH
jgi:sulfotransferase 6B1